MSKVDTGGVDILGTIAAGSSPPANTLNNAAGVEGGNAPKQSGEGVGTSTAAGTAALEQAKPSLDVSKLPISGEQQSMANADLTKAGTSNNPGAAIRGTAPGSEVVEDLEDALARSDKAADLPEFGFTSLDDHPPLKPGDKIQGPLDRENRDPTPAELEFGQRVRNDGNLTDEEKKEVAKLKPVIIDPPIDKNAPPDVPADPRKVAESRGMVFKKKDEVVAEKS